MAVSKSLPAGAIAILCSFLVAAALQDEKEPLGKESTKCGSLNLQITDADMASITECMKSAGAETWKDVITDKLACFGKCVIMRKGLTDEGGFPRKENVLAVVKGTVPEPARSDMVLRMGTCLDEFGARVDPKDETCLTYTPLVTCFHGVFLEVCGAD